MPDDQKFETPTGPLFNLWNRIVWSWQGLRATWQSEPSFRSWVYANIISDLLAFWLPIAPWQFGGLVVLGILVLAMELMNTAMERLADLVEPNENPAIKLCKDASSAATAMTAISAGVLWVISIIGLVR